MKISNILIALTLVFTIACSGKKPDGEHGHSPDTEAHTHDESGGDHDENHHHDEGSHTHEHEEHHEQEEFTISQDSADVVTDSTHHTHEDGDTHHNH
ncbi:hypothetical protein QQ020_23595 [Fulvivirgaceae bacterium BMA12]|uniref:Lipoprotein n=1 Tax=Agaribacillus aureus TaxID=3051825 RepID=A0ABT8LCZ2_9BACT|nr:hypothetical protein [Fulvivirgaceae bacterium BMA12]